MSVSYMTPCKDAGVPSRFCPRCLAKGNGSCDDSVTLPTNGQLASSSTISVVTELLSSPRSRSKRHKSGSMEEDVDTSPGGDYYTSPNSPTSSSRNWTEDMEGGRTRGAVRTRAPGQELGKCCKASWVVVQPCYLIVN